MHHFTIRHKTAIFKVVIKQCHSVKHHFSGYWALFGSLTIIGIVKILMVYFKFEQGKKIITDLSVGLSIIAVLFLAMAREPYAITVMFLLLFIKGGLLYKQAKAGQ